jgi:hypothetical protein
VETLQLLLQHNVVKLSLTLPTQQARSLVFTSGSDNQAIEQGTTTAIAPGTCVNLQRLCGRKKLLYYFSKNNFYTY